MKKKNHISFLGRLTIVALAIFPTYVMAAATDPGTAYTNDVTNSYVQDQTSQAMSQLNGILCYMSAMDPAEMTGLGNYIALIDQKVCNPNDGGGRGGSSNPGANYEPVVVNSARADTSSPMNVKVWIDTSLKAYLSATQAPSAGDPYGRFRMDYVENKSFGGSTRSGHGFINSTASGLAFYQYGIETNCQGTTGATCDDTLQLQLNPSSTTAGSGSGSLSDIKKYNDTVVPSVSSAFDFAYNATGGPNNKGFFLRTDSTKTAQLCFSRDPLQAAESVWSYGLYDSNNGDRINRASGFPIVYTDLASQAKMNGYVGYWGLWTPTTVDTTKTVSKASYNGGAVAETPYTLTQTGGKLTKFTKVSKTLDDLDKVKFMLWPQVTITGVVTAGNGIGYEIYWDKTAATGTGGFVVTGEQDPTNNFNIKTYTTPKTMTIADMQTAAPWGLYAWSQMLGGDFAINQPGIAGLNHSTTVVTHIQDIVYPQGTNGFQSATFSAGLVCILNCPTNADIGFSNANGAAVTVMPYDATTTGWNFGTGRAPYTYLLDATTGNMKDGAGAQVISTASSSSGTTGNYGNNNWGIQSGRLAVKADLDAAVTARGGVASTYLPQDYDQLATYYIWETGGNNWNQLAVLSDTSGPVTFDAPLNVSYTVPVDATKYGTFAGANVTMQYGGFGELWGIPSTCIDVTTNADCIFGTTAQSNQRWTPQFSIPAGSSVTVATAQGTIAAGTSYLVKALDKEVRLANVALSNCSTLTIATASNLPADIDWHDPTTTVNTLTPFTTVPAPRVIQGVKMY